MGLRDEMPADDGVRRHRPARGLPERLRSLAFSRTPVAPGTGVSSSRQQINTIDSFIDASNVYGVDNARLDWLRAGTAGDGNPANNQASLLLLGGYLPRASARPTVPAPPVDLMGALVATPENALVAGDVRANENVALTAIHTLFAREHNRIVASLARTALSNEDKFQLARRIVGAEIEYITYTAFLPVLGVRLDRYRGYNPNVNPSLGNEFATVGYRAHSMIHGEFEPIVPAGTYTHDQLNQAFPSEGIAVERDAGGTVRLVIPLVAAFGNPDLLEQVGEGPIMESLGERQYKNDEQIDNSLRSVLFQVPKPGAANLEACGAPVISPTCFAGVADLGADDVQRGRDHGMPSLQRAPHVVRAAARKVLHGHHRRGHRALPAQRRDQPHGSNQRSGHPGLRTNRGRRGQRAPVGQRRVRRGRGRGHQAHDPRREAEGDLRQRGQGGRVRRNGLRAARRRKRARTAAARDLEAAVRGTQGRRSLLLRERPVPGQDPADLRHHVQAHARRADQPEHRRDRGAQRVHRRR
jgi:Animal haem peroxidase